MYFRLVLFTLICASISNCVVAQVSEEHKLYDDLNRINQMFHMAHNRIAGTDLLEPVETQKQAFADIQKRKEEVGKLTRAAMSGPVEGRMEKLKLVRESLRELERELTEEILLPHQTTALRQAEFARLLSERGGDYSRVITDYYGENFDLTKEQKRDIQELNNEAALEFQKVQQEYARKVQKIRAKTRTSLKNIFTPKQIELVERLSGKKLVEEKASNEESKK